MRTIETTLEIYAAVADEYRLKCDIKWTQGFKPMKMMKRQFVSSKQQ
jgi:hypothetical protein